MIVKNEQRRLGRCLASLITWVDEIIIVDTGSTDKTISLARSAGAKVYLDRWKQDFSAARNYSLAQATKDWIFVIDADEEFYPGEVGLALQMMFIDGIDALSIDVYNVHGAEKETMSFAPSVRFFRRSLGCFYSDPVHNKLNYPANFRPARVGIHLKHWGYMMTADEAKAKMARSIPLIEKQLEEDPDNAYAIYNLGQFLRAGPSGGMVEHGDRIIELAAHGVEVTSPDKDKALHIMLLDQLAWAYLYRDKPLAALTYANDALKVKPDYIDALWCRALCLFHAGDRRDECREALKEYVRGCDTYDPSKETLAIQLSHTRGKVHALALLGRMAEQDGNVEEQNHYYREVLALAPNSYEPIIEGEADEDSNSLPSGVGDVRQPDSVAPGGPTERGAVSDEGGDAGGSTLG